MVAKTDWQDTQDVYAADMNALGVEVNRGPLTIIESSVGTWNGDAPARLAGQRPCHFIGPSDPTDPINGIATPGNINSGDMWFNYSAVQ